MLFVYRQRLAHELLIREIRICEYAANFTEVEEFGCLQVFLMAEKVGLSNETLDSDTMSQCSQVTVESNGNAEVKPFLPMKISQPSYNKNWCNKSVLWKFKCWHCCISNVVICAVIIIIIISIGDIIYCSGETHNNLDQDANIDCSGSQTFNGTFNLDSETTGNNRSLQEILQQKLVEIYNSSHMRSCLCSSRINTFRNAKVTFELKFQLPQNSSQCQEQNTKNVYSVLYAYIRKQNSSDPLKINLPSLLIF